MKIDMKEGDEIEVDINTVKGIRNPLSAITVRAIEWDGQPKKGRTFRIKVFLDKCEITLVGGLSPSEGFKVSDIIEDDEPYGKTVAIVDIDDLTLVPPDICPKCRASMTKTGSTGGEKLYFCPKCNSTFPRK